MSGDNGSLARKIATIGQQAHGIKGRLAHGRSSEVLWKLLSESVSQDLLACAVDDEILGSRASPGLQLPDRLELSRWHCEPAGTDLLGHIFRGYPGSRCRTRAARNAQGALVCNGIASDGEDSSARPYPHSKGILVVRHRAVSIGGQNLLPKGIFRQVPKAGHQSRLAHDDRLQTVAPRLRSVRGHGRQATCTLRLWASNPLQAPCRLALGVALFDHAAKNSSPHDVLFILGRMLGRKSDSPILGEAIRVRTQFRRSSYLLTRWSGRRTLRQRWCKS